MKKTQIRLLSISLLLLVLIFPSCTSDLNQAPESTNAIPGDEFLKHQSPINNLAKLYMGLPLQDKRLLVLQIFLE
jgi:hypothetical protein